MLQDIVSEVFILQELGDQQKEQSAVPADQQFERALIAHLCLLDQDVIRQF